MTCIELTLSEVRNLSSNYSASKPVLLFSSSIEINSYQDKNINRIILFVSVPSFDFINRGVFVKCFSGNILFLFFSNCLKYLRQCSSLEIVHCTQNSKLIYVLQ